MTELVKKFEANRPALQDLAFRMLGSLSEAEDAVQEAWLRLSRTSDGGVDDLSRWLTTIVARVCLDQLRARRTRDEKRPDAPVAANDDPEREASLADSVGLALMVVLETLAPAERLAFVLHDTFGMEFGEIANVLGKSAAAARQLASRARRRVRGAQPKKMKDRALVQAFLNALRTYDFDGLVAVLDPDAELHVAAKVGGKVVVTRGAPRVAKIVMDTSRGAAAARLALIHGRVGLIIAPRGRLMFVVRFTYRRGKIARVDTQRPPRVRSTLDLAVLRDPEC